LPLIKRYGYRRLKDGLRNPDREELDQKEELKVVARGHIVSRGCAVV